MAEPFLVVEELHKHFPVRGGLRTRHGVVRAVDHCRDMPAAFKLADVVVSASTDPEAFGRVVAEASAMGRPVIARVTNGVVTPPLPSKRISSMIAFGNGVTPGGVTKPLAEKRYSPFSVASEHPRSSFAYAGTPAARTSRMATTNRASREASFVRIAVSFGVSTFAAAVG